MSRYQTYTDPRAIERMANGLCPECGQPERPDHDGWGGRNCGLTDHGVATRIYQFQHDQSTTTEETP